MSVLGEIGNPRASRNAAIPYRVYKCRMQFLDWMASSSDGHTNAYMLPDKVIWIVTWATEEAGQRFRVD